MGSRAVRVPIWVVAALASSGATGVSACSSYPCTTEGYSSTIVVEVEGRRSDIADLELCVEDRCSSDDDVTDPSRLIAHGPPTRADDGSRWTFGVALHRDHLVVRALAADGSILRETPVSVDFRRVGGSARCGGPQEAIVRIDV
ncbi:hypothetical protein [Litorihabitans aurantiacus]|uniref:Secreted protein n=1 Tax=Litorihabitans aurantiacus TaxID=1930061 RepID=A0AA38CRN7_9MICO|nr:hypothetical protein [Litorihabitans aurantiacus]GMA32933.1 hypothetical protein GCM10025875_29250 [Litorihabitans aurantiacus]